MLPTNTNGCFFQRNAQENDHAMFKFVDCKTKDRIDLVCPSTAYGQNNVPKATQLQGHYQAHPDGHQQGGRKPTETSVTEY